VQYNGKKYELKRGMDVCVKCVFYEDHEACLKAAEQPKNCTGDAETYWVEVKNDNSKRKKI
jgi:SOS-response transcriptional repressor LexA